MGGVRGKLGKLVAIVELKLVAARVARARRARACLLLSRVVVVLRVLLLQEMVD